MKHRAVNPIRSIELENAEYSQVVEMPRDLSELPGTPARVGMDETTPSNSAVEQRIRPAISSWAEMIVFSTSRCII